jgi:rhodanese-related sulfurtransferase
MRCILKHLITLLILLLLPGVLCAEDYFQPIPMAEVIRFRKRPDVVVYDVNVHELWVEHSIPGAVHIDSPNIAGFLPVDKNTILIFYCAGPQSRESANAANAAVMLGFRRVFVMTDGIFTWLQAGYPVE